MRLQEFLDITKLKNPTDYVSTLLKTVHSKNITIEEWNTFIFQFKALISYSDETYVGFEHVLDTLKSLSESVEALTNFSKTINVYVENTLPQNPPSSYILITDTFIETHVDGGLTGVFKRDSTLIEGSLQATQSLGLGTGSDTVHLFKDDFEKLKQFTQNGKGSVASPIDSTDIVNKKYVDEQVAKLDFIKVVPSLDAVANPLPNKIYLVSKSDTQTQDLFDEYVWVDGKWEWVTTKQLEVDLTPYVKKGEIDEFLALPLEKGISENTVHQNGNVTTGGKAFKFSKVDAENKKFTLVHADGSNVTTDEVGYAAGDEYSFMFRHDYDTLNGDNETYTANVKTDFIGKIVSIQTESDGSTTVTVDTLHHTVKGDAVIADKYKENCLFIVPTKPDVGDVLIGEHSSTFGVNNTNVGYAGLVSGEGNTNSGCYVLMGGKFNKGGYCGLVGGRENFVPANYGTAGGAKHRVTGIRGAAFNSYNNVEGYAGFAANQHNEVLHDNGAVFGYYNKTTANNQLVGGKYANPSPEAILSIGNGTSEEQRANAFEVVVIDGIAYLRLNKTDLAVKNNCLYFRGNKVTATHATALGLNTEAGSGSLANGRNSKAQGFCTTGVGDGIVITPDHEKGTAGFGKFNDYSDTNVIFMIGCGGSDAARSNAFEVLNDGTMVGKKLKVGNTEITEDQLAMAVFNTFRIKCPDLMTSIPYYYDAETISTWMDFFESSFNPLTGGEPKFRHGEDDGSVQYRSVTGSWYRLLGPNYEIVSAYDPIEETIYTCN